MLVLLLVNTFALLMVGYFLSRIFERMKHMAVTLAQLDAAIAAENSSLTSLQALSTQLDSDVAALVAAVNGGQDFTNELAAVQSGVSTLSTAAANVQSADTAAQGGISVPPAPST